MTGSPVGIGSIDQVAVVVQNLGASIKKYVEELGFGTNDDGAYAYLETEDALGHTIEAIEMPPEMPLPERTYPG